MMRTCVPCVVMAVTSMASLPASATMLTKEECDALKLEQGSAATVAIKSDMQQGPEWAKAHLAPERLKQIARTIEVDELVAFRCPQLIPPPENIAEPTAKKGKATSAKTRRSDQAIEVGADVKYDAQPAASSKSDRKAKTKPKARPNDAYSTSVAPATGEQPKAQ